MQAFLIRVGIDQTFGGWNSPVNPDTGEFVYVPIPESPTVRFHEGCRRDYNELLGSLRSFGQRLELPALALDLPESTARLSMHLDPDFEHLTYGDDGSRRGAGINSLAQGDVLAFYAGLRPIKSCEQNLIYALIGLYVIESIRSVSDIAHRDRHRNAHTRKTPLYPHDIVVSAKQGCSGRLRQCIPIGSFRANAYRVRSELLERWGGLSVKDGFIQRSAVPPRFLNASKFYEWFKQQHPSFVDGNFS